MTPLDKMTLFDMQTLVLGTLLREPAQVGVVMAGLKEQDFKNDPGLQLAYLCMRDLFARGAPINTLTIRKEAADAGAGDAIGRTLDLLALRGTTDPLDYYIGAIREESLLLQLQAEAMHLVQAQTMAEVQAQMDKLNALTSGRADAKVVSIGDAMHRLLTEMDRPRPEFIRTGLRQLDDALLLSPGRFVGLGGYASSGKTLLAVQMALHMAQSRRVGFFSLETDQHQMAQRAAANLTGVSMRRIMDHSINAADRAGLEQGVENARHLQFDIIEASGWSVPQIRALSMARRYDVIFIDYLQLVESPEKDRYAKVTNISMALHNLAQQDFPSRKKPLVIALAQLSRPDKVGGKPVPPSLSSFRESGQIEQDLDAALILYADNPNNNCGSNRILKLCKNKQGELGQWELTFDGVAQRLSHSTNWPKKRTFREAPAQQQMDLYPLPDDTPTPFREEEARHG